MGDVVKLSIVAEDKATAVLKDVSQKGTASLNKLEGSGNNVVKMFKSMPDAGRGVSDIVKEQAESMSGLSGGLLSVASSAGIFGIAIGVGAAALVAFGFAADDLSRQMRVLDAVIKATGGTAGLSSSQIAEMADEISKSSMIEDDAIRKSSAVLLTFRSISGDTFKETMKTAADMSAVFGMDLNGSVTMLGKALEDPIQGLNALRRVGVSFNDEQKETIKNLVESGRLFDAQKEVLKGVQLQVGGAAAADSAGLAGSFHVLAMNIHSVSENLGVMTGMESSVKYFADGVRDMVGEIVKLTSSAPEDSINRASKKYLDILNLQKSSRNPENLQPMVEAARAEWLKARDDFNAALKQKGDEQIKQEGDVAKGQIETVTGLATTAATEVQEKLFQATATAREKVLRESEKDIKKLQGMLSTVQERGGTDQDLAKIRNAIRLREELRDAELKAADAAGARKGSSASDTAAAQAEREAKKRAENRAEIEAQTAGLERITAAYGVSVAAGDAATIQVAAEAAARKASKGALDEEAAATQSLAAAKAQAEQDASQAKRGAETLESLQREHSDLLALAGAYDQGAESVKAMREEQELANLVREKSAGLNSQDAQATEALVRANATIVKSNQEKDKSMFESQKFATDFGTAFTDSLESVITKSQSAGDALKSFALQISKMALNAAMAPISSGISSLVSTGMGALFGTGTAHAVGGAAMGGRPTLAGEHGPEIFMPRQNGDFVPAWKTAEMMGGGGRPNNISINIQTPDPQSFKSSQGQIAASLRDAVGRGGRNR